MTSGERIVVKTVQGSQRRGRLCCLGPERPLQCRECELELLLMVSNRTGRSLYILAF